MSYDEEFAALRRRHDVMQMAVFPEWQKAGPRERIRIAKELGRVQAEEIIKLAQAHAEKEYGLTPIQ